MHPFNGSCILRRKINVADFLKYLKSGLREKWFLVTQVLSFLKLLGKPYPLVLNPAPSSTNTTEPMLQAVIYHFRDGILIF